MIDEIQELSDRNRDEFCEAIEDYQQIIENQDKLIVDYKEQVQILTR